MKNTYQFAERKVEIHSVYSDIHSCCRDYLASGRPDFKVETTQSDIDREREKSIREGEMKGSYDLTDACLEILAVYRRIAEKMPDYDTFLFHGSAVAVYGQAYIFTAKSGTGKSTHAALWRKMLGESAVMVNDDKPLIRAAEGKTVVYGTPWNGKHHLSSNISAPVRSICILEQAEVNAIRRISNEEAYPVLLQQTYRPAAPAALSKTLQLLDRLDVRFYRLSCNMELSAAELSYHTMKG